MPYPMKKITFLMFVHVLTCILSQAGRAAINLDGDFGDWQNIPEAPAREHENPADSPMIVEVKTACDPEFIYLYLRFNALWNLQGMGNASLAIGFDADSNQATGEFFAGFEGTDLALVFSPPNPGDPGAPGAGVEAHILPKPPLIDITPYTVELAFAPTYASEQVELRLRRHQPLLTYPPLFCGDHFRAVISLYVDGRMVEQAPALDHPLKPASFPMPPAPARTLASTEKPDNTWRVVSWNTEYASLLKKPESFARILRLLDPDIVLLQEITQEVTRANLENWFQMHAPKKENESWQVAFRTIRGRLSPAIATRFPLALETLEGFPFEDPHPGFLAAEIDIEGKTVLLGSIHLPCCGYLGSKRDINREREAGLIAEWLQTRLNKQPPAAIVMGGDLNLVGGFQPLDILCSDNDIDGTDLVAAHPMHLNGRWDCTWTDPGQPFTPGRLDYVVHSDSTLQCVHSFVFDSADLNPEELARFQLRSSDSRESSDHFPLVLDYRWLGE
jgi:endonuclease/exonuclease/phosphatase family metal-dependent hydrolase